ncbi:MAG: hypothetical protein Q8N56_00050, partial [bacterium]|nr:hypothetical protein [bacterium]
MSKRISSLLFLAVVLTSVFFAGSVLAQENYKAKLYFFYGSTCYYCKQAEVFLSGLESKYPDMEIVSYEVFENPENAQLFKKFLEAAGQEAVI